MVFVREKMVSVHFILVFALDSVPVAVEQRDLLVPEVKTAKQFVVTEKRAQERVTMVDQMWQKKEVVKVLQPQIEMADDWFVLLDSAPKTSGIS